MAYIKGIAVHHFGGTANNPYASTQNFTLERIDGAHYARWPNFKSGMGYYVGYNFIIFKDHWVQTRMVGEETAAQRGHNTDTISIAVAGNFVLKGGQWVDQPIKYQKKTFVELVGGIRNRAFNIRFKEGTTVNIPISNIGPHRWFSPSACYGDLPDNWAKNLVAENSYLTQLERLQMILSEMFKRLNAYKMNMGYMPYHSCFDEDNKG